MEVKQNTAVDLNELLVPPKTADGTDELDDAIMTDLSDEGTSQDLNCDLIKANGMYLNVILKQILNYIQFLFFNSFFFFRKSQQWFGGNKWRRSFVLPYGHCNC